MRKKIILTTATVLFASAALAASPHGKPGFVTRVESGRLWVFQEGSRELAQFEQAGESAIHVSRIGAGPDGMTLKAPNAEVLDAYLGQP